MLSNEEWLHSDQTVALIRWLEKKREEWTAYCLDGAASGKPTTASSAGGALAMKETLAKIRERKTDESV